MAIIKPDDSDKIFGSNEEKFLWQKCSIIGEVTNDYAGKVIMKPKLGSSRIIDMLSEELLPRIC